MVGAGIFRCIRPGCDRGAFGGTAVAEVAPPIRVHEELPAQSVTRRPDGRIFVDFGQNLVGWVRLRVRGNTGDRIIIRHAEMLQADDELYLIALRSASATDEYVLGGDPDGETFEPRFTVHGFPVCRDHRLSGRAGRGGYRRTSGVRGHGADRRFPLLTSATGQAAAKHRLGPAGNFLSVPTDCPQRTNGLAGPGDAQVFASTAAFNYDVRGFFRKWLTDLTDAQRPNGAVTHVAPDVLTPGVTLRDASGKPRLEPAAPAG